MLECIFLSLVHLILVLFMGKVFPCAFMFITSRVARKANLSKLEVLKEDFCKTEQSLRSADRRHELSQHAHAFCVSLAAYGARAGKTLWL